MVTPVQHRVYEFIRTYINEYEYSPSLVEIAAGIGISTNSISLISRSIHSLVQAGWLKFHKKGYRNIRVVKDEGYAIPLQTQESATGLDLNLFFSNNCVAFEIKDNAAQEEGIFAGDYIIYQPMTIKENDVIVALVDQKQLMIKRISYQIKDHITLIPVHSMAKPKAYAPHRVRIEGLFTGLIRMNRGNLS